MLSKPSVSPSSLLLTKTLDALKIYPKIKGLEIMYPIVSQNMYNISLIGFPPQGTLDILMSRTFKD